MISAAPGGDPQFVRGGSVSGDSGRGGRFIFSCGEGEKRDIVSPAGVGESSETEDTFTFKRPLSAHPGIRQHCGEAACVDPVTATQDAAGEEGVSCVISVKLKHSVVLVLLQVIVASQPSLLLSEGLWWCQSAHHLVIVGKQNFMNRF